MELTLIATDSFDIDSLRDETLLYEKYLFEEATGHVSIEQFNIDSLDNSLKLILFIFDNNDDYNEIFSNEQTILLDISRIRKSIINFEKLEKNYKEWLLSSGRENNMDEYGGLIGLIGYVNRHSDKIHLIIRIGL